MVRHKNIQKMVLRIVSKAIVLTVPLLGGCIWSS